MNSSNLFRSIFVIIFISLFTTLPSFAQVEYEDIVYLKNGGIFRGTIIENIPGKSVMIETASRNVYVVSSEEIRRVDRIEFPVEVDTSTLFKYSGIEIYAGVSLSRAKRSMIYSWMEKCTVYGFNIVGGYLFNPHVYVGFGVGFDIWPGGKTLPLFIDTRFNILEDNITPYFQIDLGYSLGWTTTPTLVDDGYYGADNDSDWKGGVMFNPAFGLRMCEYQHFHLSLSIGYKLQFAHYKFPYWGEELESKYSMGILKLEVSF